MAAPARAVSRLVTHSVTNSGQQANRAPAGGRSWQAACTCHTSGQGTRLLLAQDSTWPGASTKHCSAGSAADPEAGHAGWDRSRPKVTRTSLQHSQLPHRRQPGMRCRTTRNAHPLGNVHILLNVVLYIVLEAVKALGAVQGQVAQLGSKALSISQIPNTDAVAVGLGGIGWPDAPLCGPNLLPCRAWSDFGR